MRVEFIQSLREVDQQQWNALFIDEGSIFCQYELLSLFETSGCVNGDSGWQSNHLLLYDGQKLIAALPLYIKYHSYGEYVFDWSWANAYQRSGIEYYPKIINAVPFTPVSGVRLGYNKNYLFEDITTLVYKTLCKACERYNMSGWHCLFPNTLLFETLKRQEEISVRSDVQFHWYNRNYSAFDEFLATFRSRKRKQIKRERRSVSEQGIAVKRFVGGSIPEQEWSAFYQCYCETYNKRSGHNGYLNRQFFEGLRTSFAEHLMLVSCYNPSDEVVASALFFHDKQQLYGRYWGMLGDVDCLHFEACFYQGIEFCIEHNLQQFNPGTQGEHKLFRGFEPTTTTSCHWIAHSQFRQVIQQFVEQESRHIDVYKTHAEEYLPFRKN